MCKCYHLKYMDLSMKMPLSFAVLYDTWSKVFVYWIIMFANILVQFLVKLSL